IRFLPAMPARQAFTLGRTIVVPSRAEAMPYIVLEALAAGLPMICTRVGGIPEIFAERSDVLCPPEVGPIASAMASVLRDREAYARRMPPLQALRSRFSAEKMACDIEAAYRTALGCPA